MAGVAHSTDRELINRSPRALELLLFYREVVPDLIDLESILAQRHADGERQFDAVHFSIVLEIDFNRNFAVDRALGNEFSSDEQPRLKIEEPFFVTAFSRRRLYAISRVVSDRRLAEEGHFWINLFEPDIPVKIGGAFF